MKKLGKKEMKAIMGGGGDGPCVLTGCLAYEPICPNDGEPVFSNYCKGGGIQFECCPIAGD